VASSVAATRLLLALHGGADDPEPASLLRALAAGERVATVALHETGARDWRAAGARALAARSGTALSGVKSPVLAVVAADLFLVTARDASGALGVYAAERDAPGVRCEPLDCIDPAFGLGALHLDRAPARRFGPPDADAAIAAAADVAAVALAADALGAAQRALEQSVAYAKQREQFGRPTGSFQAVQHLLVDMLEDVELTGAAVQYALWCCDHAPPAERGRAAALAKATASEALPRVCASAIQVHGGIGFTAELDLHRSYRRACAMQLLFGDASHHFASIAGAVLDAGSGA
jgi:alkylation response protein AidB-like acyl-CoA dehydrogenase